jgi:hypothetical protein
MSFDAAFESKLVSGYQRCVARSCVMKAGATSSTPSAHDVAGSREVVALYKDWEVLKGEKSPNAASRKQILDRAMRAQGLDDPTQIPAKLELLRRAEAPPA